MVRFQYASFEPDGPVLKLRAFFSPASLFFFCWLPMAAAGQLAATPATLAGVTDSVNRKMVKLFGSGGFRGLNSYGSGIVVSPDGYVLTAASPLLDTPELRVHLWDGRRIQAKVIV